MACPALDAMDTDWMTVGEFTWEGEVTLGRLPGEVIEYRCLGELMAAGAGGSKGVVACEASEGEAQAPSWNSTFEPPCKCKYRGQGAKYEGRGKPGIPMKLPDSSAAAAGFKEHHVSMLSRSYVSGWLRQLPKHNLLPLFRRPGARGHRGSRKEVIRTQSLEQRCQKQLRAVQIGIRDPLLHLVLTVAPKG